MSVLVAAEFDEPAWSVWWPALQAAMPHETLVRGNESFRRDDIDVALVANPAPGALRDLPRLGFIQSLWAGVDRLLDDRTVPPQLPLARMVDSAMNDAMAETALWAVLGLQRGFHRYAAQQREARWRQLDWHRADELSIAVLGLGQMGLRTTRRLLANGYRVTGWHASGRPVEPVDGLAVFSGNDDLSSLLARADVVINLLPLTARTRGLFDATTFARMRRGASFVNLARGAHVVEHDLLAALESGQLSHAVLDVFASEPLPLAHAFWAHPSITVLPHVAAPTDPRSAALIAARNLQAWRAGQTPEHLVDRSRGY
jgi:glyoxylate/hydroxypyruvate reductase A